MVGFALLPDHLHDGRHYLVKGLHEVAALLVINNLCHLQASPHHSFDFPLKSIFALFRWLHVCIGLSRIVSSGILVDQ